MISVVVATFGADHWRALAVDRAVPSTHGQTGVSEVIVRHDPDATLAQVRNTAAAEARFPWLLFLDGDDELDPGFGAAMTEAVSEPALYTPAVTYVVGRRRPPAKIWPEIDMRNGNWLVIGTLMPTAMFHRIGGFREWLLYEDWCLWQRATKEGTPIVKVPDAVYVAHTNPRSRNRSPGRPTRLDQHHQIRKANYPELYEEDA